jgi:hypothetical protein
LCCFTAVLNLPTLDRFHITPLKIFFQIPETQIGRGEEGGRVRFAIAILRDISAHQGLLVGKNTNRARAAIRAVTKPVIIPTLPHQD